MLAQRIDLGPVSIVAAPGWRFFPTTSQIIGRCDSRIGGIKLSLQLVNRVPPPRSNAESMALAKTFAPRQNPDEPPIHNVHTWTGGRLVGAVSYYSGQDYVRLYYIHEESTLIPIWYACKSDRRADHDCEREVSAADMMVASLQIRHDAPPVEVSGTYALVRVPEAAAAVAPRPEA